MVVRAAFLGVPRFGVQRLGETGDACGFTLRFGDRSGERNGDRSLEALRFRSMPNKPVRLFRRGRCLELRLPSEFWVKAEYGLNEGVA